jgi:hypothetical protein
MDLLALAQAKGNVNAMSLQLGLSAEALRTARHRGRLSPVAAGCLAIELDKDPVKWIVIAALETERESIARSRMLEHFKSKSIRPFDPPSCLG